MSSSLSSLSSSSSSSRLCVDLHVLVNLNQYAFLLTKIDPTSRNGISGVLRGLIPVDSQVSEEVGSPRLLDVGDAALPPVRGEGLHGGDAVATLKPLPLKAEPLPSPSVEGGRGSAPFEPVLFHDFVPLELLTRRSAPEAALRAAAALYIPTDYHHPRRRSYRAASFRADGATLLENVLTQARRDFVRFSLERDGEPETLQTRPSPPLPAQPPPRAAPPTEPQTARYQTQRFLALVSQYCAVAKTSPSWRTQDALAGAFLADLEREAREKGDSRALLAYLHGLRLASPSAQTRARGEDGET